MKFLSKFFILVLLITSVAFADPNFQFTNDFFAPGGRDRNLSNKVGINFKIDTDEYFGIHNEMRTPDNLKTSEPIPGEHPYSGYTYLSYQNKYDLSADEHYLLETRLGIVGPASKTKRLQKYVHNDLDFGTNPQGWDSENPNQLAAEVIFGHKSRTHLDAKIGCTSVEQTYGVRVGNVVVEAFLDQKINKKFLDFVTAFVGLEGHLVAFNTHLEGRAFISDNRYTVEADPFVAAARAGLALDVGTYDVGFMYVLQTPTFKDQTDNHIYGTLFVEKQW